MKEYGLWMILCWTSVDAARILVVMPTPSISHQVVARPLVHELVRRGHEVTLVTTDPSYEKGKAPANLTEIDVHDVSYNHCKDIRVYNNGDPTEILSQVVRFIERQGTTFDLQLQTPEVQELLKKPTDHFDVLILEACQSTTVGLSHKFKAPIIQLSSFGTLPFHFAYLGAPSHYLLYPTLNRQRLYNLTRWEKVVEFVKSLVVEYFVMCHTRDRDIKIIHKHFGDDADISKLFRNVKMLFINEHPIWADNRPLPPNIQYIGGIHKTPDMEMPKELKSYLDASKNGVIYMSLGTNVLTSIFPEEKREVITSVFSKLPYDILLKWDDDQILNQPSNVRVQKWFPQSTLLKHPKIKLFITQAGLQSTDEAIDAGVPLLAIPMSMDQWYNAEKYIHHKIGMQLNVQTLNEEEFHRAITKVITDKSYKENILRLRTLMEYPVQPVELAAWWTEHVIKYGGDHLKPPSAYLSWTEYYEVELVLICLGVALSTLCLLAYSCKILFKFIISRLTIKVKHD